MIRLDLLANLRQEWLGKTRWIWLSFVSVFCAGHNELSGPLGHKAVRKLLPSSATFKILIFFPVMNKVGWFWPGTGTALLPSAGSALWAVVCGWRPLPCCQNFLPGQTIHRHCPFFMWRRHCVERANIYMSGEETWKRESGGTSARKAYREVPVTAALCAGVGSYLSLVFIWSNSYLLARHLGSDPACTEQEMTSLAIRPGSECLNVTPVPPRAFGTSGGGWAKWVGIWISLCAAQTPIVPAGSGHASASESQKFSGFENRATQKALEKEVARSLQQLT